MNVTNFNTVLWGGTAAGTGLEKKSRKEQQALVEASMWTSMLSTSQKKKKQPFEHMRHGDKSLEK